VTARADLLRAFDRAIAAADRAARASDTAAERLATLREELERARAGAAERGQIDPAWIGGLVRSTAEWLPNDALPLLAALGAIARAGKERGAT
jgi:hypothetical protein